MPNIFRFASINLVKMVKENELCLEIYGIFH